MAKVTHYLPVSPINTWLEWPFNDGEKIADALAQYPGPVAHDKCAVWETDDKCTVRFTQVRLDDGRHWSVKDGYITTPKGSLNGTQAQHGTGPSKSLDKGDSVLNWDE